MIVSDMNGRENKGANVFQLKRVNAPASAVPARVAGTGSDTVPAASVFCGRAEQGGPSARAHHLRALRPGAPGFTLVELLTVIAVVAVLASLLMTAIAAAKKKSRTVVCTVGLHQFSLALDMYLDDFGKRPASLDDLTNSKYLSDPRSLLCPEDKTGNWGGLVQSEPFYVTGWTGQPGFWPVPPGSPLSETIKYSHLLHPLSWDEPTWDRLMQTGGSAGVSACQLHGLGKQDVYDVHSFSGLLLRAQRDGAVVRRQLFWNSSFVFGGPPANPSGVVADAGGTAAIFPDPSLVQIYLDDAAAWLQQKP